MSEQVKIDDTYTYVFTHGEVTLYRHGEPWLASPNAPKAWIAAANEISDLRAYISNLEDQIEADSDVIYTMQSMIDRLEDDAL